MTTTAESGAQARDRIQDPKEVEAVHRRQIADRVLNHELPLVLRNALTAPGLPEKVKTHLIEGDWTAAARELELAGLHGLAGTLRLETPYGLEH